MRGIVLRLVGNYFRRWLAHLELGTHFLDLRGLLFQLRPQLRDSGFQCLHFAIERGLLGGVGNGLGLDSGRKSTAVDCNGHGAQPSIGIDAHDLVRHVVNRRTEDVADKAAIAGVIATQLGEFWSGVCEICDALPDLIA
jgi:hypothetical protein